MTRDDAIALLERLEVGSAAREALDLAIATMRRKAPDALVGALAELDHALMAAPSSARRSVSDEPPLIAGFHQRWAAEIVEFLQAFARNPNLDVQAYAARVRAGWRT